MSDQPGTPAPRRCRVASVERATDEVRVLRLALADKRPFAFKPGQFACLSFGGQEPRDYSIASRPEEPLLEFHIRRAPGQGTSAFVADAVKPGDEVLLEGPFGEAYFRPEHRGAILALAGGAGIAPIKAIVDAALEQGLARPVHLYLGVRFESDLYLERHFANLAARHPNLAFVPVLSDEAKRGRRHGLVGEALAADFASLAGFKVYLAGPPPMVEAVSALLLERGVAPEDLHADPFYREAAKHRQAGSGSRSAAGLARPRGMD